MSIKQSGEEGRDSSRAQQESLGSEHAGRGLNGDDTFAEGGHVDDGNDEAEDDGGELVSQLEQPEEERHRGQLDANAGEQQSARPFGLSAFSSRSLATSVRAERTTTTT